MMTKKWDRQVPVYLFTGFLEAGKTSFIMDSLQEVDFAGLEERNLCLITENGMTSMSKEDFPGSNVEVEIITDKSRFTPEYLSLINDKYRPEKILLEVNGMWMIDEMLENLPENWIAVQEFSFFEASTFNMFNNNMRNLVYDKLKTADVVAFNRFDEAMDVMEFHKIVRAANRGAQIVYEFKDGTIKVDEIEDPLPFDENADYIDLEDKDYAYWYRDFAEYPEKYVGKKMRFMGMVVTEGMQNGSDFGVGRQLMTCCIDDVQFVGLLCNNLSGSQPEKYAWVRVSGIIKEGPGSDESLPVMDVETIEVEEEPAEPIATFY